MEVKFKVHGVSRPQVARKVQVDGEEMTASVQALEVELTTESDHSGSLVLRFFGKDVETAEVMFKPDAVVTASLAVAS